MFNNLVLFVNVNFQFKRSISHDEADVIRGPYNANKHSSYVELVIVVDNKISKAYGGNIKNIHKHCQDIANIVNAVSMKVFLKNVYAYAKSYFSVIRAIEYIHRISGCCGLERKE